MIKLLFVIVMLGSIFSTPTLMAAEKKGSESQFVKKAQNKRADLLEKRLFAVHVTHSCPKDGILKAGLFGKETMETNLPVNLIPDFRCTVHFSLGEMVRPVEGVISWEKCPFAVITPLSDLVSQLINVNCYDTFVLGDYKLSKKATLVLPITYKHKLGRDSVFKVQYYDPTKTTLRKTVELVIQKAESWPIKMLSNDVEDKLNKAYLNEKNINTLAFMAPLVKKYPYLSIGCRFDKVHGKAYLLGKLEMSLFTISAPYLSSKDQISTESLQKEVGELETLLQSVEQYVKKLPFTQTIKSDFTERRKSVVGWINICKADIWLQITYQKTLVGASKEVWEQVDTLKLSPDDLNQYLMESLDHIPDYKSNN